MDHDIALPNFSSCNAGLVGAKCLRGIHLFFCCHNSKITENASFFKAFRTSFHHFRGLYPHNLGYLELPGQNSSSPECEEAYAKIAHQIIRDLDQTAIGGWIIDLRRNTGGGLWFMLAGVGPILGEGECSSFVSPTGQFTAFYDQGRAWVEQDNYSAQVNEPYELKRLWPPVAVLTSQLTSSAGELVALAFRERPRTRSFGEPTYGTPTGNDGKELSDGAIIALTTHLGVDRTGRIYDHSLLPDQHVQIDWPQLGTEKRSATILRIYVIH